MDYPGFTLEYYPWILPGDYPKVNPRVYPRNNPRVFHLPTGLELELELEFPP